MASALIKILSWNIRQGGGTRVPEIASAIAGLAPQFLVLSEFRDNRRGDELRDLLSSQGYRTQCWPEAPNNANAVLVAALEDTVADVFPGADPTYAHGVARLGAPHFDLYGVYLPHKKKHALFPFLFEQIKGGRPSIIAGDYNTGFNFIDQKGKGFMYTKELRHLPKIGYQDAFRHLHGDAREYSWFSHGGAGYRYDHTYVSESLLPMVRACSYLHEWRETGLSDHSPMLLELDADAWG